MSSKEIQSDTIVKIVDKKIAKSGPEYIIVLPRRYIKDGLIDPEKRYDIFLKEAESPKKNYNIFLKAESSDKKE